MGGKPSSVGFPGITMKREPIDRIFEKLTLVKRKKGNFVKILNLIKSNDVSVVRYKGINSSSFKVQSQLTA